MIMRNDYEADRPLQERSRLMLAVRVGKWWAARPAWPRLSAVAVE